MLSGMGDKLTLGAVYTANVMETASLQAKCLLQRQAKLHVVGEVRH